MLAPLGGPRRPSRRAPLEPEPAQDPGRRRRGATHRRGPRNGRVRAEGSRHRPRGAAGARKSPQHLPTDELERLASLFRGEFLECIDLPDLHDFQAWCVAEREDVRRLQVSILAAIAERTSDRPEASLPHVRKLVQIDPYNALARTQLLGHLVALGRRSEAEQQFEAGIRQLREIGEEQTLLAAWRSLRARRHEPLQPEPVRQMTPVISTVGAPTGEAARPPLVGREAELSLPSSPCRRPFPSAACVSCWWWGSPGSARPGSSRRRPRSRASAASGSSGHVRTR